MSMLMMSESHRALLEKHGTLAARVVIGLFFIVAGVGKIGTGFGLGGGFAGTAGYIGAVGMPMPELLAVAAIILEVGGGALVLLGWHIGMGAAMLAFTCIFTAIFFHGSIGDPMQRIQFFKNLSIAGGLVYMMVYGPGTGMSCDKSNVATKQM
jgi:putative oxidoreductase